MPQAFPIPPLKPPRLGPDWSSWVVILVILILVTAFALSFFYAG